MVSETQELGEIAGILYRRNVQVPTFLNSNMNKFVIIMH